MKMWMGILVTFYLSICSSINQQLFINPVFHPPSNNLTDSIHTVESNNESSINRTVIDIDMHSMNGYDEAVSSTSDIDIIRDNGNNRTREEAVECTSTPEYHTYTRPVDSSWMEYTSEVYHEPTTTISTTNNSDTTFITPSMISRNVEVYYRKSNINIIPLDWSDSSKYKPYPRWSENDQRWNYLQGYNGLKVYADHTWIEVHRFSSIYLSKILNIGRANYVEYHEGYSEHKYSKNSNEPLFVPYGCWFVMAKGSGIFVNTGKSMRMKEKHYPLQFEELDPHTGCWKGINSAKCADRYLCSVALKRGYDSVQIETNSEFVICNGNCATVSFNSSCPPQIELRTGRHANITCNCSDTFSDMINCGPRETTNFYYDKPKDDSPMHYRPRSCVGRRDHTNRSMQSSYNVTLAVASHNISSSVSTHKQWKHNLSLLSSSSSFSGRTDSGTASSNNYVIYIFISITNHTQNYTIDIIDKYSLLKKNYKKITLDNTNVALNALPVVGTLGPYNYIEITHKQVHLSSSILSIDNHDIAFIGFSSHLHIHHIIRRIQDECTCLRYDDG